MTEREALNWEPIREFWRNNSGVNWDELEAAIKEALAQPGQEPVGTVQCINGVTIGYLDVMQPVGTKLYTTPPQRTWVGLTDKELDEFSEVKLGAYDLCLEVEAKLKEKNSG